MALDFGNLFAAIGRTLPGFVEGERMAVQDNRNDLNQYNRVQAGQLQNAFDEAVFQPRIDMMYDQGKLSGITLTNTGMQLAQNMAMHPALMAEAQAASLYAPQLALLKQQAQQQLLSRMAAGMFPQGGWGGSPWYPPYYGWDMPQAPSGM